MVIIALCTQRGSLRLSIKKLGLTPILLRRMLQIGLPAGLQFITFDLANLLVQSSINTFGDITVAAWTACTKSDSIIWMTSGAFGVAVTTFVGQNFGAQKYRRVRQSVWVTMGMSVAVVGLISAVLLLFRRTILGFYTTDEAVIAAGSGILMITVPLSFVFMPVEVFAGTMRGTGYSVMPTVITCSCVCVYRVLWVFLVVSRWHKIEVLAAAYPISWILAAIVFYIAYLRGTWLKKRIQQCGMKPET
jgi:Na+-driven multidrug efflux pump